MKKIKLLLFFFLLIFISLFINNKYLVYSNNDNSNNTFSIYEKVYSNDKLEMAYLLYIPSDYNVNTKYRLVLFLHGAGDRGFDYNMLHNIDYGFVSTFLNNPIYNENTILLIPQCPVPYLWVEDSWESGKYSFNRNEKGAISDVKKLVDLTISSYSVNENKVYAVGVSMGGMGVWDLIARYPGFFAAAAPVCGALDPRKINEYLKTPIFTCNDLRDNIVGALPTYNTYMRLKELNHKIIYKEYDTSIRNDDTYHSTWVDAFTLDQSEDNLYNFIFSFERKINNDLDNDDINEKKII